MTNKEIRALIEKRMKDWKYGNSVEAKYKREECDDILELIDSLHEEPVSSIWHDVREMPNFDRIVVFHYIDGVSSCQYCGQSMKGVLDWCYLDDLLNKQVNQKDISLQEKKNLIASLQKDIIESIGEETMIYQGETYTRVYKDKLDEYACKYPKSIPLPSKKFRRYSDIDLTIAIKAGSQWQKNKMMEDATDVTVHIDAGGYPYIPQIELYDYNKDVPLAKEGDKYKVVLIKENKDE